MPLNPGVKLGPYEVLGSLGAGGMGEVYRAKDTRLNREVAIKVLPEHLSASVDLRARFDREAKAISSLQHPHICVLHDVGSQDGVDFLVMELIEGETLADRMTRKPLSVVEALRIAIEVASALDKAHRCGIVHRDLKPGNIMLTRSGSKLMDFGLAKPSVFNSGAASRAPAFSATMTSPGSPITMAGTVVGTVQYMSPEQIQGKEADARSDIFAFGAVLYEMLTGTRAFDGKSQLSVASAILEKEPEPICAVKPLTPPALDHIIKRALEKDPDSRWQSAHDLAGELKWIAEADVQGKGLSRGSRSSKRAAWGLAAISLVVLLFAAAFWWNATNRHASPMYFNALVTFAANDVALSPDGRILALTAYSQQVNNTQVWVHAIASRETTPLDGTEGAAYPFWSGDGRFIGFFADGKLKKVDASGRQVQVICEAPNGRGGAWNSDGVILFFSKSQVRWSVLQVRRRSGLDDT
jgi:serine/threonine protein kinase